MSSTGLTLALIELILKHGPVMAIGIIKALKTDNPTVEDIKALTVEGPEHYFGE